MPNKSRIPSPARSHGAITPRRYRPRSSRSVGSPALSTSTRLTTIVKDVMELSPMIRRSVLNDDSDIIAPGRKSWWKNLGENSEVLDVLQNKDMVDAINVLEDLDVEILSQGTKNYSVDLQETSDEESIKSIVISQRKLFTEKENVQKKFQDIIKRRETLNNTEAQKSRMEIDKDFSITPKSLFKQQKKRPKPVFPAALLSISANKTVTNDKTLPPTEPKNQGRTLFGNRPAAKRKNMFVDFIVSDSEDEIPEMQPKIFSLKRPSLQKRRGSSISNLNSPTASIPDIEIDDWRHLPSSTMMEHQLMEQTTPKQSRRSKVSGISEKRTSVTDVIVQEKQAQRGSNVIDQILNIDDEGENIMPKEVDTSKSKKKLNVSKKDRSNKSLNKSQGTDSHNNSVRKKDEQNVVENVQQSENENNEEQVEYEQNLSAIQEEDKDNSNMEQDEIQQVRVQSDVNEEQEDSEVCQREESEEIGQSEELNEDTEVEQEENNEKEQEASEVSQQQENKTEVDHQEDIEQGHMENGVEQNSKRDGIEEEGHKSSKERVESEVEQEDSNSEQNDEKLVFSEEEQEESQAEQHESEEQLENEEEQQESEEEQVDNEEEQQESEEERVESEVEQPENEEEQEESEAEREESGVLQDEDSVKEESEEEQEESQMEQDEKMSEDEQDDNDTENDNVVNNEVDRNNESPNADEIDDNNEPNEEISNSIHDFSKKNKDETVKSPEAILKNQTLQGKVSLITGRNTSVRKTKSVIMKNMTLRPSLAPIRDSMEFSDGTRDSSGNNSGWDSHRTTRKTMRQTFGKDFTPRKSLRTLVMEKSAKRQTNLHDNAEISKMHQANSTEYPQFESMAEPMDVEESNVEESDREVASREVTDREVTEDGVSDREVTDDRMSDREDTDDRGSDREDTEDRVSDREVTDDRVSDREVIEDEVTDQEITDRDVSDDEVTDHGVSDHEMSKRTKQTTLEMYLQKIKSDNMERKRKMEEEIRNSLKTTQNTNIFKIPQKPAIKRTLKPANKPKKTTKHIISLDMLPEEVREDLKYKPPKRYQPKSASWVTKRLYKFLETKLEPQYDYKARIRAEKLVEVIFNFTRDIRRFDVAPQHAVDALKHEMARLRIVNTHFEFYEFFKGYMPRDVRNKVVPDVVNKISLPKPNVFAHIIR